MPPELLADATFVESATSGFPQPAESRRHDDNGKTTQNISAALSAIHFRCLEISSRGV